MHAMEGYLRPGCVHLTVQALLTSYAAARHHQLAAPAPAGGGQAAADAAAEAQPAAEAGEQQQQQQQQQQQSARCCGPAANATEAAAPAAQPAAAAAEPAAAAPEVPAPGPCCAGHKRAAEAAAQPASVPASTVRRVVQRMLASGEGGGGGGSSGHSGHGASLPARLPDCLHTACRLGLYPSLALTSPLSRAVPAPLPPRTGEALWRSKTMLVQAGAHVALVHAGRLRQVGAQWPRRLLASALLPAPACSPALGRLLLGCLLALTRRRHPTLAGLPDMGH